MHHGYRYAFAGVGILAALLGLRFSGIAQSQQNSIITLDKQQLNFMNVPSGGTSTQTVNVTSTTSTAIVIDTTNSPPWLKVTPSATANVAAGQPTPLTVQV